MKTTRYLTLAETLHLHTRLVEEFGGDKGVRDLGLLESALYRPQSGYYETLSSQAAALMQSLALNRCFHDGNKRVAYTACKAFLALNGWKLSCSADDGESFLVDRIIRGHAEVSEISAWIAPRMTQRENSNAQKKGRKR